MSAPATNPLTYNGYVTQIATMAVVNTTTSSGVVVGVDAAFNALIPQMLNYAELRIQRDLDLQTAEVENNLYTLTPGNNQLVISVNDYVTIQTVQVTSNGMKYPLIPTSKEFLQNIYPSGSTQAMPGYFAIYGGDAGTYGDTYQNILIGPVPDQAYPVTLTGTIRLQSLAFNATPALANTATTFISVNLPDLLIMASMIYISAFQRNFGRMSDDPAMAQSYEAQYQTLLRGALPEEYRKKFEGSAWSSSSQAPATSTRG